MFIKGGRNCDHITDPDVPSCNPERLVPTNRRARYLRPRRGLEDGGPFILQEDELTHGEQWVSFQRIR